MRLTACARLPGQSEADLPGYGRITSSVNLISNGKAIAEVIGSPDNHETSVYRAPVISTDFPSSLAPVDSIQPPTRSARHALIDPGHRATRPAKSQPCQRKHKRDRKAVHQLHIDRESDRKSTRLNSS